MPFILDDYENYFCLYKPAGWFVHPPDDKLAKRQFRHRILTDWLDKHLDFKAYPVHRLDFATDGILLWAKNRDAASTLSAMGRNGEFTKLYRCVIRGVMNPGSGFIEISLKSKNALDEQECKTEYETQKTIEISKSINSSYASSRYSLMGVKLHTGRWHQIRRHFNRVAHPIIGDRLHGDSHHNRYFRDQLGLGELQLQAHRLLFEDPWTKRQVSVQAPETEQWKKVLSLFQA